MLIVDNCVGGFANHLKNGIPILPFYGDETDKELLHLKDYLFDLIEQKDNFIKNNGINFQLKRLRFFKKPKEYIEHLKTKAPIL